MDKIKKLLQKISTKERAELLALMSLIVNNDKKLKTVKIKNTDFFRVRHSNFRIIFHKEKNVIVIDSIKLRKKILIKICN